VSLFCRAALDSVERNLPKPGLQCFCGGSLRGYSTWASSYSIYNSLLQTQPELVEALAEEFYLDRKDEIPEGEGPWFKLPIFSWYKVSVASSSSVHLMCL